MTVNLLNHPKIYHHRRHFISGLLSAPMFKRKFQNVRVKKEGERKKPTLAADHEKENSPNEEDIMPPPEEPEESGDEMEEEDANNTDSSVRLKGGAELSAAPGIVDESDEFFEAGAIVSVEVQDFMCHKKFSIQFGRLFNFVTGRNGAGDHFLSFLHNPSFDQMFQQANLPSWLQFSYASALLPGNQEELPSKITTLPSRLIATHIYRVKSPLHSSNFISPFLSVFLSSTKGLIRDGSPGPAVLTVTLLNEGIDAYMPHKYGNRIRIERRLTRVGAGGYNLISAAGKVSTTIYNDQMSNLRFKY